MSPRSPLPVLTFLAAGLLGAPGLHAQQPLQDAPPINLPQMLKDLQKLQPQSEAQAKAAKLSAAQTISAAANSGDGGVTFWQNAIKGTQMEGAGHESNEFRIWKETDGEIFKEKLVQEAVHLHLEWLALTLQHSAGATVKEMMPAIANYLRELWADKVMMTMLEESVKKEKEASVPQAPGARGARNSPVAKALSDDRKVREVHDQILNKNLNNSLITNWMHLHDYVAGVEGWENVPGNLDGIYLNVVQPEWRAERDQRVFEYWDTKMKVESETAGRTKLNFEIEKYNNETAPVLLFDRAQEYIALGLKNRAATEMYGIIQKYPTHPQSVNWITTLQNLLVPPPEASPGTTATPAPAPAPSAVAPAPFVPAPAPVAPAPVVVAPVPAAPPVAPSPGVSATTLSLPGAVAPPAPRTLPGQ